MTNKLTIPLPNDMHIHFREGILLDFAVNATAKNFHHAVAMPNLKDPITSYSKAINYYDQIQKISRFKHFEPLVTLYLTVTLTEEDIQLSAQDKRIIGAKLYPAGVTTNSEKGVSDLKACYKIFELMEKYQLPLLIHGEVANKEIDIFDREKLFIDELIKITSMFPALKVIFEHISTKDAVQFIEASSINVAATITPQHMILNRNDLLSGGLKPHHYCLPVLKREEHRIAVANAAVSGNAKFFLGTDSAPHPRSQKESSCGCAGIFSAIGALEIYLQYFEAENAIDNFENFAVRNSCAFYGLKPSDKMITFEKSDFTIPAAFTIENHELIPLMADQKISWKILNEL